MCIEIVILDRAGSAARVTTKGEIEAVFGPVPGYGEESHEKQCLCPVDLPSVAEKYGYGIKNGLSSEYDCDFILSPVLRN